MDREPRRRFEAMRRALGAVENQVVDDLRDGELDRSEFIKRGTMVGLSASALGTALAAGGEAPLAFARSAAPPPSNKRLAVGIAPPPAGIIEPLVFSDAGRISVGSIAGEFLTRTLGNGKLQPELAVSWTPNANATTWTAKLRKNVRFQTGKTMTAADVVATFKRLTDPKGPSQALSAFKGVLVPDGVKKGADDLTVVFELENPTASFPYLISSTTYNAIVLPADYQYNSFVTKPQGTGAYMLTAFNPGVSATYQRFTGWWGGKAPMAGVDATIYNSNAALDAALIGGTIQLVNFASLGADRGLFNNPKVQIFRAPGAAHIQVPMRVDIAPFNDARIRQAIALTVNRPQTVTTLYGQYADLGNDNPYAPIYSQTVPLPQRNIDIKKAKQLMAAAKSKGFTVNGAVEQADVIPGLAAILNQSVKEIGIDLKGTLMTDSVYFNGTLGANASAPWLNAPITMTGWGHRSIPNVYLTAALMTGGIWNAAHYSNKKFDSLARSYLGAIALSDQRKYAQQIEQLLLNDTPVMWFAFANQIRAGTQNVRGFQVMPQSFYLSTTYLV
jgi:peptide/nickel transport system substrate-binding protein